MSPLVSQAEELIAFGNPDHAMLSSLHPRLFRGVTPDRHDGGSHVTHTENADLHIPATRLGNREPARTASTHVPYAALQCGDDAPLIHRLYF